MSKWQAVLIAGPTASGKSALALDLAARHGGAVVNADSMQVYHGLRIVTARPSAEDMEKAPHRLYGHVEPTRSYSAGEYVRDATLLIEELSAAGTLPIVCGGTGLYFKALFGQLDRMPAVPAEIRSAWRQRLAEEGAPALHRLLGERDAVTAARLAPNDGQRIVRALEIAEASGRTLSSFQEGRGVSILDPDRCLKIVVAPERGWLREVIADRFARMLDAGALEEVAEFRRRPGAMSGPAARAIGVAEIVAMIDGVLDRAGASERAITRSRQYAKRQETWFRGQFGADWKRISSTTERSSLRI